MDSSNTSDDECVYVDSVPKRNTQDQDDSVQIIAEITPSTLASKAEDYSSDSDAPVILHVKVNDIKSKTFKTRKVKVNFGDYEPKDAPVVSNEVLESTNLPIVPNALVSTNVKIEPKNDVEFNDAPVCVQSNNAVESNNLPIESNDVDTNTAPIESNNAMDSSDVPMMSSNDVDTNKAPIESSNAMNSNDAAVKSNNDAPIDDVPMKSNTTSVEPNNMASWRTNPTPSISGATMSDTDVTALADDLTSYINDHISLDLRTNQQELIRRLDNLIPFDLKSFYDPPEPPIHDYNPNNLEGVPGSSGLSRASKVQSTMTDGNPNNLEGVPGSLGLSRASRVQTATGDEYYISVCLPVEDIYPPRPVPETNHDTIPVTKQIIIPEINQLINPETNQVIIHVNKHVITPETNYVITPETSQVIIPVTNQDTPSSVTVDPTSSQENPEGSVKTPEPVQDTANIDDFVFKRPEIPPQPKPIQYHNQKTVLKEKKKKKLKKLNYLRNHRISFNINDGPVIRSSYVEPSGDFAAPPITINLPTNQGPPRSILKRQRTNNGESSAPPRRKLRVSFVTRDDIIGVSEPTVDATPQSDNTVVRSEPRIRISEICRNREEKERKRLRERKRREDQARLYNNRPIFQCKKHMNRICSRYCPHRNVFPFNRSRFHGLLDIIDFQHHGRATQHPGNSIPGQDRQGQSTASSNQVGPQASKSRCTNVTPPQSTNVAPSDSNALQPQSNADPFATSQTNAAHSSSNDFGSSVTTNSSQARMLASNVTEHGYAAMPRDSATITSAATTVVRNGAEATTSTQITSTLPDNQNTVYSKQIALLITSEKHRRKLREQHHQLPQQSTTSYLPQDSTSNLPQQATSTLPQQSTSNLLQDSTSNLPQQATSTLPQQSTSNLPQLSTPTLSQQSTSNLSQLEISNIRQELQALQAQVKSLIQQTSSGIPQQQSNAPQQSASQLQSQQQTHSFQAPYVTSRAIYSYGRGQIQSNLPQPPASNPQPSAQASASCRIRDTPAYDYGNLPPTSGHLGVNLVVPNQAGVVRSVRVSSSGFPVSSMVAPGLPGGFQVANPMSTSISQLFGSAIPFTLPSNPVIGSAIHNSPQTQKLNQIIERWITHAPSNLRSQYRDQLIAYLHSCNLIDTGSATATTSSTEQQFDHALRRLTDGLKRMLNQFSCPNVRVRYRNCLVLFLQTMNLSGNRPQGSGFTVPSSAMLPSTSSAQSNAQQNPALLANMRSYFTPAQLQHIRTMNQVVRQRVPRSIPTYDLTTLKVPGVQAMERTRTVSVPGAVQPTGGIHPNTIKLFLPENWACHQDSNLLDCNVVHLDASSSEYLDVVQKIAKTVPNRRVKAIHRIENPYLLTMFLLKKAEMIARHGHCSEQLLYHGTHSANMFNILTDNLDWRKFGTNAGHTYGCGVYFGSSAYIANGYARNTMFLVRVLIYWIQNGTRQTTIPAYESDTTTSSDGSVTVKYDDFTYLPEYMITFEDLPPRL